MHALTVNAWACHILVAVWVTGISGIFISAILTYKILDDCKKREARRKRQKDLYHARTDAGTAAPR